MSGAAPSGRNALVVDPFGLTADPRAYIPRPESERARQLLEEGVLDPQAAAVRFSGPSGFGKTLLLRLLRDRLGAQLEVVQVPHPSFGPGGFWLWVTSELHAAPGLDPKRTVRRLAAHAYARGSSVLLLVDDAHALPAATLSDLLATSASEPGLRLVLGISDGDELAVPLPENVPEVRLAGAMTLEETQDYVLGRLTAAGVGPAVRRRFDPAILEQLHRLSDGVPIRVHALADRVMRGIPLEATAPRTARVPSGSVSAASISRWPGRLGFGLAGLALGLVLGFWLGPGAASRWLLATRVAQEPTGLPGPAARPPSAPAVSQAPTAPPAVGARAPDLPRPTEGEAAARVALPGESEASAAAGGSASGGRPQAAGGSASGGRPQAAGDSATGGQPQVAGDSATGGQPQVAAPAPPKHLYFPPGVPVGRLHVNASPWARIEVDGVSVGETPLGSLRLPYGTHRVVARFPDGTVAQRTIHLGEERFLVFP